MTKIVNNKKIMMATSIAASVAAFAVSAFAPEIADIAQIAAEAICNISEDA